MNGLLKFCFCLSVNLIASNVNTAPTKTNAKFDAMCSSMSISFTLPVIRTEHNPDYERETEQPIAPSGATDTTSKPSASRITVAKSSASCLSSVVGASVSSSNIINVKVSVKCL